MKIPSEEAANAKNINVKIITSSIWAWQNSRDTIISHFI
jgi:lipid A disaccharide synthetase